MSNERSSSRREFLSGKSAANALGDVVNAIGAELPDHITEVGSVERQSTYLEEYSKPAMACEFQLLFNMQQYSQSAAAAGAAFELIDDLEDQMTVYRDHSEVSRLNATAFDQKVKVEHRLFELLRTAQQLSEATAGAFDITSGQLSNLWGFEQRSGKIPDEQAIQDTLKATGSHRIEMDDDRNVSFSTAGVKINLGGIGKGYAIDRVASLLRTEGIADFAIHGGQSSVLCAGQNVTGEKDSSPGWPIGLSHPVLPEVRLATFYLQDQALGTSGSGRQGFFHQGKRYGHIIDPRTGWPTDRFLSTTVITPSAARSDALATAFFVMELKEIEAYCRDHPEVSAVVAMGDPAAGRGDVELISFNLSDQQWQRS